MADPNSSNHWDLLASELGAETPPPTEESRPPCPPPSQLTSAQKAVPRPRRPDQPASPPPTADWDLLAGELGLAPLPPPPPPPPPSAPPPPETAVAVSPVVETSRRSVSVPETAEESPNFFDERFDFEEPFDLLEAAEPPAAAPEAPAEPTEPAEKRPRKRRRRRRRDRETERGDGREQVSSEADAERSADVAPAVVEDFESAAIVAEVEAFDAQRPRDEAATPDERREKRRRSRRKKRKPHGAELARTAAGESADAEAESEAPRSYDVEAIESPAGAEDYVEAAIGDEAEAERPGKLGFRGIPTWEEAIGMIVDKNLESRAKRSGGGPHPGGGKHGPRNSRGARGGKRRK